MSTQDWQRVGKDYSFYEFELEKPFIGVYDSTEEVTPDDKKKNPFKVHKFYDHETGELVNISDVFAIAKAIASVEKPTETLFKFVFKGKKDLGKGRTVNAIDAFTMPK